MNPNYRSRLVARQLKATDRSGETFFAPAPPLEALRTVLSAASTTFAMAPEFRADGRPAAGGDTDAGRSRAAGRDLKIAKRFVPNWDPTSDGRTQLSLVDVKRAYFNATIAPEDGRTYVELPPEGDDHGEMAAELLRHMYGTRGAAEGWQEEYSTMLVRKGFRQGRACPNIFFHPTRLLTCSVHGGD